MAPAKEFEVKKSLDFVLKKSRSSKKWGRRRKIARYDKDSHRERERRTHVHTHKGIRQWLVTIGTRPQLGQVFVCFCFLSFDFAVGMQSVREWEEYLVTRQSALQDYKLGNGRWPGDDDDETSGLRSFVGASFSDRWHPESAGVWRGSVDASQ
jgi:hypothetical protein